MIELGKTYKDGIGRDVRIICVDRKDVTYTVVGLIEIEGVEATCTYSAYGKSSVCYSDYDLILPEDFNKFAIDEPVMVRNHDDDTWRRDNFAGVSDSGKAKTWVGGTKWASGGVVNLWNQCRRPTKEELES